MHINYAHLSVTVGFICPNSTWSRSNATDPLLGKSFQILFCGNRGCSLLTAQSDIKYSDHLPSWIWLSPEHTSVTTLFPQFHLIVRLSSFSQELPITGSFKETKDVFVEMQLLSSSAGSKNEIGDKQKNAFWWIMQWSTEFLVRFGHQKPQRILSKCQVDPASVDGWLPEQIG